MHAENLPRDEYRLDWELIEQTIAQQFDGQDALILYMYFGLKGHDKTPLKVIGKTLKLKPKILKEKLAQLEKALYKQLKAKDLDEVIVRHIQEMSLVDEILESGDV